MALIIPNREDVKASTRLKIPDRDSFIKKPKRKLNEADALIKEMKASGQIQEFPEGGLTLPPRDDKPGFFDPIPGKVRIRDVFREAGIILGDIRETLKPKQEDIINPEDFKKTGVGFDSVGNIIVKGKGGELVGIGPEIGAIKNIAKEGIEKVAKEFSKRITKKKLPEKIVKVGQEGLKEIFEDTPLTIPKRTGKQQLVEREASKIARQEDLLERESLEFFEDTLEDQFQQFKKIVTPAKLDEIADVTQLKKKVKAKPEVIDNILFSQKRNVDEVFDMFKERRFAETAPITKVAKETKAIIAERARQSEKVKNKATLLKEKLKQSKQDDIRNETTKFIRENLPTAQQGKFLTRVSNIKTAQNASKIIDKVGEEVFKIDALKQLSKEVGTERSKIAFIRKMGEFNQTVANEIRAEVGLTKPLAKATKEQLDQITSKLKDRLEFKKSKGFKPTISNDVKKDVSFSKEFYDQAVPERPGKLKQAGIDIKDVGKEIKKGTGKLLSVISTRLKNIDPSLKRAIRKFEFNNLTKTQADRKRALPYFQKTAKMSSDDFSKFDLALKNGDERKINEMLKKYGMEKEFSNTKKLLDDLYERANKVGYDMGYQKNYFPRVIKDPEGFIEHFARQDNWGVVSKAIQEKEMNLGRALNVDEKATLINTMIRGYSGGNLTLSKTGAMKSRKIDFINPELNEFYADSNTSLSNYINQTNEAIEARKFFGKELSAVDDLGKLKTDDSIGAYTTKLLADGKINIKQEQELRDILQARFGERGTSGIISIIKNLNYIDVMGSPLNAITQIGDLAFPLYKTGPIQAIKSLGKSVTGKTPLKKEDLGIEQIATEFTEKTKTANAVSKIFKIVGLEKIDTIGKNTLIDATVSKMQGQAKNNDPKLFKELQEVFGNQVDSVLNDLKRGEITEDVKYLAFNKLLDFQPVALSEVPEQYLKSGNGRIFYALKTWTIKMFDVFRNEAFQKMASNDKATRIEGAQNMIKLGSALIIMNGTADSIKDLMVGNEIELDDVMVDNIAKLFGMNKYSLDVSKRSGIGTSIKNSILPPTQFIDNSFTDIVNSREINELKSVKSIPVVGKLYYWWFGRGNKDKDKNPREKELKKIFGSGTTKRRSLEQIFK